MATEREVIYRLKAVYDAASSQSFAAMSAAHGVALKEIETREGSWSDALKSVTAQSVTARKKIEEDYTAWLAAEYQKRAKYGGAGGGAGGGPSPMPAPNPYSPRPQRQKSPEDEDLEQLIRLNKARKQRADDEHKAQQEADKVAAAALKERDAAQKKADQDRARATEKAIREQERLAGAVKSGSAQMKEGFLNAAEGIGRVARGFTLLGFASDESLQKLLKNLAVVQGLADIVMGSVKGYEALRKGVEAYTLAVNAAKAAEVARVAAQAAGTAGGVTGSAGGAGALAGGAGVAGIATGAAALVAAVGSVTFALAHLAEFFQKTADGNMTAGTPGSWTHQTGKWQEDTFGGWNPWGWAGRGFDPLGGKNGSSGQYSDKPGGALKEDESYYSPYTQASNAEKAAQKAQKRADQFERDFQRKQKQSESGIQLARDLQDAQNSFEDMTRPITDARQSESGFFGKAGGEYDSRIAQVRGRYVGGQIKGNDEGSRPELRAAAFREAEEALQRQVELTKEQYAVVEQMNQSSMRYHQEAITAAQKELDIRKQESAAAEDSLMSFKEKFGLMDATEQARAKSLLKRSDEATKLREGGDIEAAKKIERSFSREDLSTLKGYGLEGATNTATRGAFLKAEGAGLGDTFGREERRKADELKPEIERLTQEVTGNVKSVVRLELDAEQYKQAFQAALVPVYEDIKKMNENMARQLDKARRSAANDVKTAGRGN